MDERKPAEQPLLADGGATAWSQARDRLKAPERDRTYWLATVAPNGRPHVRPLLGLWLDGAFYFVTAESSRKGRNLAADPRCVVAASSTTLPALDIVIEGDAVKVTDQAKLRRVTEAYGSTLGWPLEIDDDGGVVGPNAPTAGPPPYAVFELTPTTIVGLPGIAGTEEGVGRAGSFDPTRWRF
jgi:hypothetical protein